MKHLSALFRIIVLALLIFVLVYPPYVFLRKEFQEKEISEYAATKKWQVVEGDVNTFPGCAYLLFDHYIAYCADDKKTQSTNDLNSIRIDEPITLKKSIFSEIFRIPEAQLDTEICFRVDNYFEGFPKNKFDTETRLFVYDKPIDALEHIHFENTQILTVKHKKCVKAESGMTLLAIGPGEAQFFTPMFYEGLLKSGKFNFMKDDSKIINYSYSGGVLLINGIKAGGVLTQLAPGEFAYSANLYKDTVDFNIVKKVVITSRISINQKIILIISVISVWFLIIIGFIESSLKLRKYIFILMPNLRYEIWRFLYVLKKKLLIK